MEVIREGDAAYRGSDARSGNRREEEPFAAIDLCFGRFVEGFCEAPAPSLRLAAALVSRAARSGSSCLDLKGIAGRPLPAEAAGLPRRCPPLTRWRSELLDSPVVAEPGRERPLILDPDSRLYLYRYWEYETEIARFLLAKGGLSEPGKAPFCHGSVNKGMLRESLARLFPAPAGRLPAERGIDWQKVAALTILLRGLTVISGGPGTGKTVTTVKAVMLLLEQSCGSRIRIALAAPTGKAAARLQEAVTRIKNEWSGDPRIQESVPDRAMTLHRLLGVRPNSARFRHDRNHLLPLDVVIVDEASMVDLPLMARLIRALPAGARLILLGDRNQLASVEAGAVLSDICGDVPMNSFTEGFSSLVTSLAGEPARLAAAEPLAHMSPIGDSLIELKTNYRFPEEGAIHRLSVAVNRGEGEQALSILKEGEEGCRWVAVPPPADLQQFLVENVRKYFKEYVNCIDNTEELGSIFDLFERFRILCALRNGPYGATEINRLCERVLFESGLVRGATPWYSGRPVMITTNDYALGLFNGDVGLILPDPQRGGEPGAFFRDAAGALRRIAPARLPAHETVYALTIHKSQGSEFDHILVLLPDRDAPLLTRELIYTAVTRARRSVAVWGDEALFLRAVSRRIARSSGLRDALRAR